MHSNICPVCAKPIQSEHAGDCRECRDRNNHFSFVRPAGVYEGALKEMIHYMKFNNKKGAARMLASFMQEKLDPGVFEGVDMLVPAPLSKRSMAERGYNQTENVAVYISKAVKIPVVKAVVKVKDTPPQNKLDRKERMKNLKGAFEVKADVAGKRIVVVDDVFTTGSTINEIAKALIEAGAEEVRGITAARSI
jgi:ComF family protein